MISEIKQLLGSGKLIIGTQETVKALRKGALTKIYIASNMNKEALDDITHWAKLAEVEIVEVGIPNEELGTVCKKPFAISVIGLSKE